MSPMLIITHVCLHLLCSQAPDQEVCVAAMAVLANLLSYSDTLLLTDSLTVEILGIVCA